MRKRGNGVLDSRSEKGRCPGNTRGRKIFVRQLRSNGPEALLATSHRSFKLGQGQRPKIPFLKQVFPAESLRQERGEGRGRAKVVSESFVS